MESEKNKPYSEMTIEELKALAKKGDAKAQNNLGVYYARGEGVRKNHLKAVEWWTKAAEQAEIWISDSFPPRQRGMFLLTSTMICSAPSHAAVRWEALGPKEK